MPELPEVETVLRGLAPVMVGATLDRVEQRRPDLRFPFPPRFVERLQGRRITALDRRAKYLQARLDDGTVLVMHLGMSGSFRIVSASPPLPLAGEGGLCVSGGRMRDDAAEGDVAAVPLHPAPLIRPLLTRGPPSPASGRRIAQPLAANIAHTEDIPGVFHHPRAPAGPHDHVVFHLSNGARIVYNDPRRFGFMLLVAGDALAAHPLFARLGIEPLSDALDGTALAHGLAGRAAPLKAALLDQTLIAGLGNIYVCEALHRAGLSPRRAAGTLVKRDGAPTKRAETLAWVIKEVLLEAVAAGGSSLRDHRQADGTLGYFQHTFRVYDREDEPCPKLSCAGVVKRIVQSGRSTFFCPVCQR